jgi:hypothetical protein
MEQSGTLIVSIDMELAWGICDKVLESDARAALQRERTIIQRLLALFADYEVRASWAIVGHLLADQCEWKNGQVHPEIDRPIAQQADRDWFFQHPRTPDDPLWYGRDIVDWITAASPTQEIGSHSFCHLPYSETHTRRAAVKADISTAKALHARRGLPFEVFIFPRNVIGYRDLLAQAGVRVYRGNTPRWYDAIPFRPLRRLLNLSAFVLAAPPPTVRPSVDEVGMVNVPDSMLLLGRNGLRSLIPSQRLVSMGRAGVDRAVERREIFHLWFHPSNFAHKMDEQFQVLEEILRYAHELRKKNQLKNLTLGDVLKTVSPAVL